MQRVYQPGERSHSSRLRIMTYNIHKAIGGVDRRYDPGRIIDTIEHNQPDILMLQEVDDGVPRSRHHRQVDLLGDALGYQHRVFQGNVTLKQGQYGNAILSRYAISESWDVDLKIPMKKARRAQVIKTRLSVDGHTRTLVICNTHLGLAGLERVNQIRKLLACEPIANAHHDTPMVLGGDFNDVWSSIGRRFMLPYGFRCAVKNTKTFPAVMPVRSLDAIYYRGDLELETSFAGHTEVAHQASDHLPVVADFVVYGTDR